MQSTSVILALDPATKTGCAVGTRSGTPDLNTVNFRLSKACTQQAILGRASKWIGRFLDIAKPAVMAIEAPFFIPGRTNMATHEMCQRIYGIFVGRADENGVAVWPVAVPTWRKSAMGRAKLGGRDAAKLGMKTICQQLGWDAPDDNAADAAGIFMWASGQLGLRDL